MSYLDSYQKRGISFQRHKLFYTTDIACGSEKYTIQGIKTVSKSGEFKLTRYAQKRWTTLTWNEIFSVIAPYLTAPIDFNGFKEKLTKAINSAYNADFSYINDDCAQTVKVQFFALGLIKCYQKKLINGGLVEAIEITEKGSRYLVELKTVKGENFTSHQK